MKLDRYELKKGENATIFEFISDGPNGQIVKIIQFMQTEDEMLYNLAFGDKDPETGEIDDKVISNNGDSQKVLASVVAAVFAFTDSFPDAFVFAMGSTGARTRLYRMGLSKYFKEAVNDFDIYGERENKWELFVIGREYSAFVIKRKPRIFELWQQQEN